MTASEHIVVVDDDGGSREIIVALLGRQGYQAQGFANGLEALDHLRSAPPPDLILLDLRMPVMDGWEFRVEQRQMPMLAETPVIAISGDSSAQAAAIDADHYLRKPFEADALLNAVRDVLASAQQGRMKLRLAQADRLASLGRLAAGVAHEMNTPLAFVHGNLEFIACELARLGSELHQDRLAAIDSALAEARQGVDRVVRVVRDLKTLSRVETEKRRPVDLVRVLDFAVQMATNEIRHRARLVKEYSAVPPVEADEPRLGQVFINLLLNAAESMVEGRADENEIRLRASTAPDGVVIVEVHDSGAGIPESILGRIFDPFFTTKPVGVGTGLGLSICHGVITALGGQIAIESEVGRGSVVRVKLPASKLELPSAEPPQSAPVSSARRARILVVDDEPLIGATISRALAQEHDVVSITSAREALARLLAGDAFDLIFCDLMMPVMTGMDFFAQLSAARQDLAARVVFLTGGAFGPRAQAFLEQTPNARLEKPFQLQALRAFIRTYVR